MNNHFKIAAGQACPVYLDRDATITKACHLIAEAGAAGAHFVVFPEAFVPGYPLWVWFIPAGHAHPLRELYAELLANAVAVPSEATKRLCDAAREAGVVVAMASMRSTARRVGHRFITRSCTLPRTARSSGNIAK